MSAAPAAPIRRKVFVVEDAPDVRAALTSLFEVEGLELAGTASTETAAIQWLEAHPGEWSLAVIDLLLLDGSGFSVLRRFADAPNRGRIVIFSGFISDVVRERCMALGADAVILKTDIAGLVRIVGEVARGHGSAPDVHP